MSSNWFEISFFSNKDGHGNLEYYFDFDYILKSARKFKAKEKRNGSLGTETEYIGIESNTDTFAILYITEYYLNRIKPQFFKDVESYDKFIEAGKKFLKTNKEVISTYSYLKYFEVKYYNGNLIDNYFMKATDKKDCRKIFTKENPTIKIKSIKEICEHKKL